MIRSVVTCAKVTLFFLNLYVLAVVLVVVTGQWRIFETSDLRKTYDDSHLQVMRELQEEQRKPAVFPGNQSGSKIEPPLAVTKKPPVPSASHSLSSDRVATLRQQCRQLRPNLPDLALVPAQRLQNLLVDDKHKLLLCSIPGVANNDWRRLLLVMLGKVKVKNHLSITPFEAHNKYGGAIKKLSEFSAAERKKRLQTYTKVMFVREPLEHLFASYKDKFTTKWGAYFHKTFGTKIVRKYRRSASKKSLETGADVQFAEFLQYVVDTGRQDEPMNEHWEQYYKQCHPCVVQYDYIGKYESLNHDVAEVLRLVHADKEVTHPLVSTNFTYPVSMLKNMYKTVPARYLQRLWKLYATDYDLFSYEFPDVLKSLLRKEFSDY